MSSKDVASKEAVTKWQLPGLFEAPAMRGADSVSNADVIRNESEQARQAGFDEGRRSGLAAAQSEIGMSATAINDLLASLASPISKSETQIAKSLLQLSIKLAEIIIHREVACQPELIEKQVQEALATMTSENSDVVIRLHPEDAKILKEHQNESEPEYSIVEDSGLHRGGCILKTRCSTVDATIEKQLTDLLVAMFDNAAIDSSGLDVTTENSSAEGKGSEGDYDIG